MPQLKMKCEPLGDVFQTKKGGFLRKFLVADGKGGTGREVMTAYADNAEALQSINDQITVKTGDFFFLA